MECVQLNGRLLLSPDHLLTQSKGCRGVGYVSMLLPCGLRAEHKDVCESKNNFIKSPLWLGCVVSHAS